MMDMASNHLLTSKPAPEGASKEIGEVVPLPWSAAVSRREDALLQTRNLIALQHKSVITFDVFDTFLFRRCTAPDGVFERAFHHLPGVYRRAGLAESFVQNRILAELRAREKSVQTSQTGEVTIEEIYRRLPRQALGLQHVSIEDLVTAELRAELDLCLVNPVMLKLAHEAQSRPRPLRIGFVSDTYWSATQLHQILLSCAPGLLADFIYTSADQRTCKTATLFSKVTRGEGYSGIDAIHIGDNAVADIMGAEAFGISAVYYPQPQEAIQSLLSRESLAAQLLQAKRPDFSHRLDRGLSLARRSVLPQVGDLTPILRDTAAILGPVLSGFQHFLQRRIDQITAGGGKAAVLFLGRDGYLPFQRWQDCAKSPACIKAPAHYVEINRRVALVANARQVSALQDVFVSCTALNEASVQAFLKVDLPAVKDYFAAFPDGICDGKSFAAALPGLMDGPDMETLSDSMRHQLLAHLRHAVPSFDDYTDLVLVDLGYYGTIQRALRGVFDRSSLPHHLHGVYLATVDDAFAEMPDGDSVSGFIDSSVIPPSSKLFLLRNIALLEQLFSAPHGSVRTYERGAAQHEAEIRSSEQLSFCANVQAAAGRFAHLFDDAAIDLEIDLPAEIETLRDWCAVLILRLLAFPTLAEQEHFGGLKQDVNLGTYLLYDMINTDSVERLERAMGVPSAGQAEAPPMWLGGSMTALSALHGCAYGLGAFGLSTQSILEDQQIAHWHAKIMKDGQGITSPVSCLVTASGELRLRVPLLPRHAGGTLALPIANFLQRGLVRGITLQHGATSQDALTSQEIRLINLDQLRGLECRLDGAQFTALSEDAHLLIALPQATAAVTVLAMTVLPLPPVA